MAATVEKSPTQELIDANLAVMTAVIEAGYKAQTRGLNIARVLVEGAGRQQEHGQKLISKFTDAGTPWYAPERYNDLVNLMVENQNEVLRIGREYIDELNAAADDGRQAVEAIVKQADKAREAQQSLLSQGFSGIQQFASTVSQQAAPSAR